MICRPASGICMIDSTLFSSTIRIDADHGAEIAAAAAEDVGAADHHRGDRRQQIGVAHPLVGLGRVAGEQHARRARRSRPQSAKAPTMHEPRVDAGEIGRAPRGCRSRRCSGRAACACRMMTTTHRDQRPRRRARIGMPSVRAGGERSASAASASVCGAKPPVCTTISPRMHRIDAEREDHRRHAQIGDAEAVDEADGEADAEADRDRPRRRRPRSPSSPRRSASRAPRGRSGRAG